MLAVQNALNTVLIVGDLLFQPNGQAGDTRVVERRTAALYAAVDAGQLTVLEDIPEPGDAFIMDEVVGTGVEQSLEHGLADIPSDVAVSVTYVPAMGYGDESAKPYEVTFGAHTDTHVKVTATSGIRFKLIVSP